MTDPRPPIPDPDKRLVRQRCGFGCVICGHPIYEYEHMDDYSKVREHDVENITLLCDGHHRLKTGGLMPVEVVKQANAAPYNLRAGKSKPFELYYSGTEASILVGSVEARTKGLDVVAVRIDGHPIIGYRFEGDQCLLQINFYDEDNKLVLQVVDNELVYSVARWDIEFVGSTLTIRNGLGDIFAEIRFRVPRQVCIPRGRLHYNGIELEIWPDGVAIVNSTTVLSGVTVVGAQTAINIGDDPNSHSSAIMISGVNREFDRAEAQQWLRKKRAEIKAMRDASAEQHTDTPSLGG